jgi:hypothetical protein
MSTMLFPLDENLLRRVRAEFREVPGLRLTIAQAQRLWGLDRATCEAVLGRLTETRVLSQGNDGRVFALESSI